MIDVWVSKDNVEFLSFTDKVLCERVDDEWECVYLIPDKGDSSYFTDIFDGILLYGEVGAVCNGRMCEILNSKYPGIVGFYTYKVYIGNHSFLLASSKEVI